MYVISRVERYFFTISIAEPKTNTMQTNFSFVFVFFAVFGCAHQKELKLIQCLDMDDMTRPNKFDQVS